MRGGFIMKSIFGLDQNIAAVLSYVFGPFSGIAVLIMERENKFVRFHALQSTLWFLFIMVVGWMLGVLADIPFIGVVLGFVVAPALAIGGFLVFCSWVLLMLKAFSGETFKLPVVGDVVWSQINK